MIYSYTERKIGSYFGEDLYECCFDLSQDNYDANEQAYTVDLGDNADKVIDCVGFIYSINVQDEPYKLKLPINVEPKLTLPSDRKTDTIYAKLYDRAVVQEDIYNATVFVCTNALDYAGGDGIIKVQYTKLPTE